MHGTTKLATAADARTAGNVDIGAVEHAVDDQVASLHRGVAGEGVVASQQQLSSHGFVQRAGTGEVTGVAAVGVLLEGQRCVVDDRTLQAAGVTARRAAVQRGATAVSVSSTENEITATVFQQTAGAGHRTDQCGVLITGQGQLSAKVDGIGQLQR
ncbi:hypothetical protein D3C81_1629690 [compost metagenome]